MTVSETRDGHPLMTGPLLLLRDLIHERTGLFFADGAGTKALENRLKPLLERTGCASHSAYYRLLENEPGSGEWLNVISALSKPVSSFFRHIKRVEVLVNTVMPRFLSNGPIKIWSAGCATGEEPIAIAMALSEAAWFDGADIEINASDANFTVIERARAGVYGEPQMPGYLSPELRDKYFEPVEEGWRVNRELHERIRWSVTNLMVEDEVAELAASQIIFCRNVFIYFSKSAIVDTLSRLARYMPEGGYLFTDEGDYFSSIISRIGRFQEEKTNKISIWRRGK
jgi:chemotaxis protein methyltransferase CheR